MRDDMLDDTQSDRDMDAIRASDAGIPDARGSARLVSLEEVKGDYKVAEEDPDIRGWDVKTSDDVRVGKVDDLIVDTQQMKVRYMTVKVDGDVLGVDDDRYVLIPIGEARLDDDDDDVWINLDASGVAALPAYDSSEFDREYESSIRDRFTTSDTTGATTAATTTSDTTGDARSTSDDFYAGRNYDETRLFGNRRKGRENEQYISLAEERLQVDKREVSGGEARVRKTVETERVTQSVPVEREEVTIERRTLSPDSAVDRDIEIGEDEIRIPLKAEEVVVDKRIVPTEEVVIKKRVIREEKTVEADLRKERLDVDDQTVDRTSDRTIDQTKDRA